MNIAHLVFGGAIIRSLAELRRVRLDAIPSIGPVVELSMCGPDRFAVQEVQNAHMGGHIGRTDLAQAIDQWTQYVETLAMLITVTIMRTGSVSPDAVFMANAAFLGTGIAVMSNMTFDSRREETPFFAAWLEHLGYEIKYVLHNIFEGGGDALMHPGKVILWGGYGFRSQERSYEEVARHLGIHIILLQLVNKYFYHLDTCFCPLDSRTVLYYPGAFTSEGIRMIEYMFPRRIAVTFEEAMRFSCNSVPIGQHVVMPDCSDRLRRLLEFYGFNPIVTPMTQFMLSGGANACCVLRHYIKTLLHNVF